jgi:hypothetical protein
MRLTTWYDLYKNRRNYMLLKILFLSTEKVKVYTIYML